MLQKKLLALSSNDLQEKGWLLCGTLILKDHPENFFTISQHSVKVKREAKPALIIFSSEFSSSHLICILQNTTERKLALLTFFRSNLLTEPFRYYSAKWGNLCLPQKQISNEYQIRRKSYRFASGTERPPTLGMNHTVHTLGCQKQTKE